MLHGAALNRMMTDENGIVGRDLLRRGTNVQNKARRLVGVKSGRLRRSIVKRLTKDSHGLVCLVGSSERHALLHHKGTRPHRIYPHGKALAFFWPEVGMVTIVPAGGRPFTGAVGGVFIIGKGFVDHPGTAPNHYLEDALGEAAR